MSDLARTVAAFAAADTTDWQGLPDEVRLADLADLLSFDAEDLRRGEAGDPLQERTWVAAATDVYAGGLRLWLSGEAVVALEGIHPVDADGELGAAPDLGEPDLTLESVLGPLHLAGGELVHAARGLALRTNPANGLLLGLVGFAATTAEDYRRRVRPEPEPTRPLREVGR